ncbi:hypothetical protein SADUNF_Sadunf07G0014300 [Salix dunnii]|uniref:Uncharacterized protein n=1 Tax=Salix dunnii TaxID=1413687 RepID=A0A835JVI3_9ROSI|nr:hypothetical protein SADUNF_Sadunf07G0014300 [Salix dunnii]
MEIAREFGALLCLALVFCPFLVLGLNDFEERNGVAHFNTSKNDVHSSGSHNVQDDARDGRTNSTYKDALVEHNIVATQESQSGQASVLPQTKRTGDHARHCMEIRLDMLSCIKIRYGSYQTLSFDKWPFSKSKLVVSFYM